MADVLPLIQASLTALKGGALPPTDVVKALISKVGDAVRCALCVLVHRAGASCCGGHTA